MPELQPWSGSQKVDEINNTVNKGEKRRCCLWVQLGVGWLAGWPGWAGGGGVELHMTRRPRKIAAVHTESESSDEKDRGQMNLLYIIVLWFKKFPKEKIF